MRARYGVVMGLKGNQPELHEYATKLLERQAATEPAEAETPWECSNGKRIRRQLWRRAAADGYLDWQNLRQVWLVRQTTTDKDGAVLHVEDRYNICNVVWRYWLARRSRHAKRTWEWFNLLLRRLPLPPPRIVHRVIW